MPEGELDIQETAAPLIITEGESISPSDQRAAAEKGDVVEPEEKEEPKKTEDKTEEPATEKKDDAVEKEPRTPSKTIPYGKFAEERRLRKQLEAELADYRKKLETQVKQETGHKTLTEAEKAAIDAQIAADPAKWVEGIVAKRMADFEQKMAQREAAAEMKQTLTSMESAFKGQPEAKDDPDFEENIAAIIEEHPYLASAPPQQAVRLIMREYRDARQSEAVKESKEQVRAKLSEGGKVAKLAVADAKSAGSTPAKKIWTSREIQMEADRLANAPDEVYNKFSEEIDLAEKEGRIRG